MVRTKIIAIQVDDTTYDRLNQMALAKGVALSDYVRSMQAVQKLQPEELDARLHTLMEKLKKDAQTTRGSQYYYTLKEYKSVGKRIRVYWRTKPLTEYDALMKGAPDKVGMHELRIQKETTRPPGGGHPGAHVEGDWYAEKEERKYYYKRRGLHRAINSLCRRYGQPEMYKEGPKQGPEPSTTEEEEQQ